MTQPNFSSLTNIEAASNIDLLRRHYDANSKKTELVFGTWAWGRRFIRIDKNEKILYRTIYWIFAKVRIIQTEENNPVYFNALKTASENKFKQLAAPYVTALTSANETHKHELTRLEKLRTEAVEFIHSLKKGEGKLHKAHAKEKESLTIPLKDEIARLEKANHHKTDAVEEMHTLLHTLHCEQAKTHEDHSKEIKQLTDEFARVEKLRAEAVEHIHALKAQEDKTHEAHAIEKENLEKLAKQTQGSLDELLAIHMPLHEAHEKLKDSVAKLQEENKQLTHDAALQLRHRVNQHAHEHHHEQTQHPHAHVSILPASLTGDKPKDS